LVQLVAHQEDVAEHNHLIDALCPTALAKGDWDWTVYSRTLTRWSD
jgi:hypothetical protein